MIKSLQEQIDGYKLVAFNIPQAEGNKRTSSQEFNTGLYGTD